MGLHRSKWATTSEPLQLLAKAARPCSYTLPRPLRIPSLFLLLLSSPSLPPEHSTRSMQHFLFSGSRPITTLFSFLLFPLRWFYGLLSCLSSSPHFFFLIFNFGCPK